MDQVVCKNILQSIKSNDLVSFSASIKGKENLCFGRFPILTLCYLYNAKKILSKYERVLRGIDKYHVVLEDFEIFLTFRKVCGRTLRLYLKEGSIVSPIEMLAILHKDGLVKKNFKYIIKNEKILNNLKAIYSIHNQQVQIYTSIIKIGNRPFSSYQQRQRKFAIILSSIFIVILSAGYLCAGLTIGLGTSWSYFAIGSKTQLQKALNSNGSYILNDDIQIDTLNFIDSFSGEIDGKGHTIYIDKISNNSLIAVNNGTIKNLNIVYRVMEITDQSASLSLLVGENNGVVDNISILSKNLKVNCLKSSSEDIFINGFANINNNIISNCSLDIRLDVVTSGQGECYVSGFVGKNKNLIDNCVLLQGSLFSTTEADVSGVVFENDLNAKVTNCKNYATISQSSSADIWSPNVAGIVLTNYGLIKSSHNYGNLTVNDTCDTTTSSGAVFLGGIASLNYRNIENSLSNAELIARSISKIIYCGGISAYSNYYIPEQSNISYIPEIRDCGVSAKIDVLSQNETAYVFCGGFSGYIWGVIADGYSVSTFVQGNTAEKYFVGTAVGSAYLQYQIFSTNICLETSNVFVTDRDNVLYQIGSLVNNGSIVSAGVDNPNNGIITSTEDQIKSKEVYWNE